MSINLASLQRAFDACEARCEGASAWLGAQTINSLSCAPIGGSHGRFEHRRPKLREQRCPRRPPGRPQTFFSGAVGKRRAVAIR